MENLGDFGLIFIRKDDPIGKLTSSITKQKYNIIGFYFKTNMHGKDEYKTLYYDIYGFNNLNCKSYKIPSEMQNIKEIINNPLVSCVSVKPLKKLCDEEKTQDLIDTLKLAMIKYSNDGSEKSVREWIYEMFGYPLECHTKGNTSIQFINKVMKEADIYCKIKQNTSLDPYQMAITESKKPIENNSEGKVELFQVLGSGFTQSTDENIDKLIQSYLYDNEVFGEIIEIDLPTHTKLEIELESELSIKNYNELIKKFGYNLTEMLTSDPKFCEIAIGGINKTRNHEFGCNNSIKLFSPFVIDMMKNNGNTFIGYTNECGENVPLFEMKLENVFSNMLLYGNFEADDFTCNDRVVIYKKDGEFLHAFRNMYCQIKSMCEGEQPDLNKLVEDMNIFIKCTKLNYENICSPCANNEPERRINIENDCDI